LVDIGRLLLATGSRRRTARPLDRDALEFESLLIGSERAEVNSRWRRSPATETILPGRSSAR